MEKENMKKERRKNKEEKNQECLEFLPSLIISVELLWSYLYKDFSSLLWKFASP